jgi:hypothetical protein
MVINLFGLGIRRRFHPLARADTKTAAPLDGPDRSCARRDPGQCWAASIPAIARVSPISAAPTSTIAASNAALGVVSMIDPGTGDPQISIMPTNREAAFPTSVRVNAVFGAP